MQAVPRCIQWHIVAEEEEASGLRGAATFASVSGRPRHAGWETCATTIGRANPKIAGSRPGGGHARWRAWARLTRRHGRSPIPLEIAKNHELEYKAMIRNMLRDSEKPKPGSFNEKQRGFAVFDWQRRHAAPLGLDVDWERRQKKAGVPPDTPARSHPILPPATVQPGLRSWEPQWPSATLRADAGKSPDLVRAFAGRVRSPGNCGIRVQ